MPNVGQMTIEESKVLFTNVDVVVDVSTITNEEWLDYRRTGIGGSDVAAIYNISKWSTAQDIYKQKKGIEVKIDTNKDKEFIFEYGHLIEPLVANEFERRTGFDVIIDTHMYRSRKYPFMICDVDRVVFLPDGSIAILECKTTTEFNKDAWEGGAIPKPYKLQAMHYMATLDVDVCYIACIYGNTPNEFICHRIERDLEEEKEMIEIERNFWENHVLANIEPAPSNNGLLDIEVFRKYSGYADPSLPVYLFDKSDLEPAKEIIDLMEMKSQKQKEVKDIDDEIKKKSLFFIEKLKNNIEGEIIINDDHYLEVKHSPRSYTKTDLEKLRLVYPDAYSEVVQVNPENSRVFSIKQKKRKKLKVKTKN